MPFHFGSVGSLRPDSDVPICRLVAIPAFANTTNGRGEIVSFPGPQIMAIAKVGTSPGWHLTSRGYTLAISWSPVVAPVAFFLGDRRAFRAKQKPF